jgi:hypothetical protein
MPDTEADSVFSGEKQRYLRTMPDRYSNAIRLVWQQQTNFDGSCIAHKANFANSANMQNSNRTEIQNNKKCEIQWHLCCNSMTSMQAYFKDLNGNVQLCIPSFALLVWIRLCWWDLAWKLAWCHKSLKWSWKFRRAPPIEINGNPAHSHSLESLITRQKFSQNLFLLSRMNKISFRITFNFNSFNFNCLICLIWCLQLLLFESLGIIFIRCTHAHKRTEGPPQYWCCQARIMKYKMKF